MIALVDLMLFFQLSCEHDEQENYLIILRYANGYLLPWTAYCVEYRSRREKLLKEYEESKNAKSSYNTWLLR